MAIAIAIPFVPEFNLKGSISLRDFSETQPANLGMPLIWYLVAKYTRFEVMPIDEGAKNCHLLYNYDCHSLYL